MDFNHLSVMSWQIHGLNHSSVSMFGWFANCEQLVAVNNQKEVDTDGFQSFICHELAGVWFKSLICEHV
jgi:hypothetical protein